MDEVIPRPLTEYSNPELIDLFKTLSGRMELAKTVPLFNRFWECRRELEKRIIAPSEMFRCLGFAFSQKEVNMWPIWVCGMKTVDEAMQKQWIKEVRKDPLISRQQKCVIIYGITGEGTHEYLRLNEEYCGLAKPR